MKTYKVASNQALTSTTILLTLEGMSPKKKFEFQPGQYAAVSFKRKHRPTAVRCFSIVSSPTQENILQFGMRTKGRYTRAMRGIKSGDHVKVRGPFGGFVIDLSSSEPIYMLAGGIGITPFISMIRYANAVQSRVPITLIFSGQDQIDVPFADEIMQLEKTNPNFKAIFIVGNGPADRFANEHVITGRLSPEQLDLIVGEQNYANQRFYICGPPGFMKAMSKTLRSKGVIKSKIVTEAFGQGPEKQTGRVRDWPFNMYILGALGLVVGSFIVMVSDLFKTLPPSSIVKQLQTNENVEQVNSRQSDLDSLVNGLPPAPSPAPETSAAQAVLAGNQPATPAVTPTKTVAPTTVVTPAPVQTVTPQPVTTASSDRRLKHQIRMVATLPNGIKLYRFFYKSNPLQEYVGVMAQDILAAYPEAVSTDQNGY